MLFPSLLMSTNRIGWLGEHGFANFVLERSAVAFAKAILGEDIGGLPSHQQLITSKIENQSGDVMAISFEHVKRLLIMLLSGIIGAGTTLLAEVLGKKMLDKISIRRRNRIQQQRIQRWMKTREYQLRMNARKILESEAAAAT